MADVQKVCQVTETSMFMISVPAEVVLMWMRLKPIMKLRNWNEVGVAVDT